MTYQLIDERTLTDDVINSLAINAEANLALVGFDNGRAQTYDLQTGELLLTIRLSGNHAQDLVTGFAVSHDGQRVAIGTTPSGFTNSSLVIALLTDGAVLNVLESPQNSISAIAFTTNDTHLISTGYDGTLIYWRVADGAALRQLRGHDDTILAAFILREDDGLQVVTGGGLGNVIRWRIDQTLDDLLLWTSANNYVRDFSCAEQRTYGLLRSNDCGD